MTRFFERGTVMAEMERQMTMAPNFTPRGHGSAVLCRYRPTAADVDCRNCLEHRRQPAAVDKLRFSSGHLRHPHDVELSIKMEADFPAGQPHGPLL